MTKFLNEALGNNLSSRFNLNNVSMYCDVLSVLWRCNRKIRNSHSLASYIKGLLARFVSDKY